MVRLTPPGEAPPAEAARMLREAADLAAEHYGDEHPACLLPVLEHLDAQAATAGAAEGVGVSDDERATAAGEAADAAARLLRVVAALAARYRDQRDVLSVVLLLEAALREVDGVLVGAPSSSSAAAAVAAAGGGTSPSAPPELARLQRQADDLFGVLSAEEARQVVARRQAPGPTLLRSVAREFTEQLGAYAPGGRRKSTGLLEQWRQGLPLNPIR